MSYPETNFPTASLQQHEVSFGNDLTAFLTVMQSFPGAIFPGQTEKSEVAIFSKIQLETFITEYKGFLSTIEREGIVDIQEQLVWETLLIFGRFDFEYYYRLILAKVTTVDGQLALLKKFRAYSFHAYNKSERRYCSNSKLWMITNLNYIFGIYAGRVREVTEMLQVLITVARNRFIDTKEDSTSYLLDLIQLTVLLNNNDEQQLVINKVLVLMKEVHGYKSTYFTRLNIEDFKNRWLFPTDATETTETITFFSPSKELTDSVFSYLDSVKK